MTAVRRGPVPAVEHIDERVALGQGRQFGLQAEQTAQFAAIGQAPVVLAGTFACNLASIVCMAGALAGMQIRVRGHGCASLCVPLHRQSGG